MSVLYVLAGLIFVLLLVYKKLKSRLTSVILGSNNPFLTRKLEGKISVLTYNIAGLPERISSANTPRKVSIVEIGKKIKPFDIVNVQEDFNYNFSFYSHNKHPFRTQTKGKIPYADGLNSLSKYPILEYHRIPWRQCNGSDCWTLKGFTVVKIQLDKQAILEVYNVHANSGHSGRSAKARRENLRQLGRYIQDHSADRPLIVMGDFNAYYTDAKDNLPEFLLTTGLRDGWVEYLRQGTFPEVITKFVPVHMLEINNETESLDKIFLRNSENLHFKIVDYQVEIERFKNSHGESLSDHLAISMQLEWKWKD